MVYATKEADFNHYCAKLVSYQFNTHIVTPLFIPKYHVKSLIINTMNYFDIDSNNYDHNSFYLARDNDFVHQSQNDVTYDTHKLRRMMLLETPPSWDILTEILENDNKTLFQSENLTINIIEYQKEIVMNKCQSLENEIRQLRRLLQCAKEEVKKLNFSLEKQDQTSFNKDSILCPYVHDAVRCIFRWKKFIMNIMRSWEVFVMQSYQRDQDGQIKSIGRIIGTVAYLLWSIRSSVIWLVM